MISQGTDKHNCEVCSLVESKYKCPKCLIKYCSLGCYKSHKETCETKKAEPQPDEQQAESQPTTSSATVKLVDYDDELKTSQDPPELKNIQYDFVSSDKLKLLEDSVELKNILANRHLRDLLVELNNHDQEIDDKMQKAMQEPLFQEFSDVCLKIVQNNK